jgi:GWxTD domain-containing protein
MLAVYQRALRVSHVPAGLHERTALDSALARAFRRFPNEPRIYIALGYLRYAQGRRVDAGRMLGRAEERFDRAEPTLTNRERAAVAHLQGRIAQDEWRDYRTFGQLSPVSQGRWHCSALELEAQAGGAAGIVTFNLACPATFEAIMDTFWQPLRDLRIHQREELEARYRAAIALDTTNTASLWALAGEYIAEADWTRLRELARHGRSQTTRLLHALTEYRAGRDSLAAQMFRAAFDEMNEVERDMYLSPQAIMSATEARTFASLPPDMQRELGQSYWRSREVLFLSDENDRLLEHWARVTEADAVFGDHPLGIRGWNTSPGELWIRYGRPLKIRDLLMVTGRGSFWSYGPDPDIVFTRNLTYSQYRVHEEATGALEQIRERAPTRFRPPHLSAVVTMTGQVARFRTARDTTTDLLIVAPYPPTGPEGLTLGFTLLDDQFRRRAEWKGAPTAPSGIEIAVPGLVAGSFNLVVEALESARGVLHQLRDTINTRLGSGFSLSDLLLVRDLRGPPTARSRRALTMDHLHAARIAPGDPVTVYWEVYDPPADTAGRTEYQVAIEVRDASRRPFLARALRTIAGAFQSDGASTRIEYTRTAEVFDSRVIDWVTLSAEWRPGTYEVTVAVRRADGTEARARRVLVVSDTN